MKHIIRLFILIAALVLGTDHAWASAQSNSRVKFVYESEHGSAFASAIDSETGKVTITVTPVGDYRCKAGDLTAEQSINSNQGEARRRNSGSGESLNKGVPVDVTCVETNKFTLELPADETMNVTVYVKFSEKQTFTPTVSIEDWTYGADANEPSLGDSNTSGGGETYTYADTENGSYNSTVPTQAGTHWVKATVAATADYKECVSAPVEFTISQKQITIASVGVEDKEYDGTTSATLSGTSSFNDGMIVGDDVVSIDLSGASALFVDKNAGTNKNVTVIDLALAGPNKDNYTLANNIITTTGNITQKDLTVTAKNKTINYGDEPANDGVEYGEFVEGEGVSALSGTLGFDYGYSQYGPVGTYQIMPKGLSSSNYNIIFQPGTLTVNQKATISVDWEDFNDVGSQRPTSLDFKLLANGSDTEPERTVTLNEGNNWSAEVNGLTAYNGTDLIEYTWSLVSTPETLSNNYNSGVNQSTSDTGAETTFRYTRNTCSLKVTNTVVSDLAADADREFEYTVKLTNADISGTFGDMEFSDGEATVTLKSGESATATGLLYGISYIVTRGDATGFQLTGKTGDTGTISATQSEATFTNTRETGDLTVTNTVDSDLSADAVVDFTFTITLDDTTINGTYGEVAFEAGKATFTLKGGESKSVTGLPTTLGYTVEQADADGIDTSKTGDTGAISTTVSVAAFTNTRQTGDLKLSNTVESDLAADADREFTFTITLDDTTINGTYGEVAFEAGKATFTLKGRESAEATSLPTTLTYTVTQATADGFDTEKSGDTGTIGEETSEATFTNTREMGDLTVSNTVASDLAADRNVEFTFTVTLGDNTISKAYGDMTFENGVATVTLKGGESATAEGLPTTLTYGVEQATAEGFTTTPDEGIAEGEISTTESKAEFTNTRQTGDLTVTNTVDSDLSDDATVEFEFTIYLSDTTINGEYGDITFADGVATFKLKGAESKSATGLPTTLTYNVMQADVSGFTTTSDGDTGTIGEETSEATFTNTRETGDLEVSNTVRSVLAADATVEFTFTVTLSDTSINDTYGGITFVDGEATFNLKGGQSVTAEGLPTTLTYRVEQATAEGFTTTPDEGIAEGEISTTESEATFTNTRETGDLEVSNTVRSVLAADATVEFTFTVTLSDTSINDTYGGITFVDGEATFNLKGGQSVTAEGLPTTLTYRVEQATAEGFTTTPDEGIAEGEISTTESKAEFTNERETNSLYVYNTVYSDDSDDATVDFTFTITLEDTSISGTYSDDMTFENGVAIVTLKGGESASAGSLPTTLGYTVTQTAADGFTTYSQDENQTIVEGTTVEGTISDDTSVVEFKNIKTFSSTVKIVWDDNNDQDGKQPTEMTATLEEDNDGNSYEVTLNSENSWTATFNNLPMYNISGEEITYTWTQDDEDLPEGYDSDTTTEGNITTITNSHTPETTEVKVTKVWDDNDNAEGFQTVSVTVHLKKGDDVIDDVELNADNNWTYTWSRLDKYNNGTAINYTVTEDPVANYSTQITKATDGTFTYTVTNSRTVEKTQVSVEAVWDDTDNAEGFRPESITVRLLANGEEAETVTLNVENEWKSTWTGLNKYADGLEIEYTVSEDQLANYKDPVIEKTSETEWAYTVTNSRDFEEIEVKVSKVWDDNNNEKGFRPTSVTVNLMNGNTVVGSVDLDANNEWTYTWSNLQKYENGDAINYTVTEDPVDKYLPEITKATDGTFTYTVTNTLFNVSGDVTVTKDEDGITLTFTDNDNNEGTVSIPTSIEVDRVVIERTFVANKAATVCLPFSIAVAKVSGGTFHTFTSVDTSDPNNWIVNYTAIETTGSIVANTPYIFLPDGTNDGHIVINNTDKLSVCTADPQTVTQGQWNFIGTYNHIKWTKDTTDPEYSTEREEEIGSVYGFAAQERNGAEIGDFVKVGNNVWVDPMRAYLKYTSSAARQKAGGIESLPEKMTVVIRDANGQLVKIDTFTLDYETGDWYSIDGSKLPGKPKKKGVYIHNGKSVVIK